MGCSPSIFENFVSETRPKISQMLLFEDVGDFLNVKRDQKIQKSPFEILRIFITTRIVIKAYIIKREGHIINREGV